MSPESFDRPIRRVIAMSLAIWALLGWHWAITYYAKAVDAFELLVLATLLLFVGLVPSHVAKKKALRLVIMGFVVGAVGSFIWWMVERGVMEYGGYDVGGIALRIIAYGLVINMLMPNLNLKL